MNCLHVAFEVLLLKIWANVPSLPACGPVLDLCYSPTCSPNKKWLVSPHLTCCCPSLPKCFHLLESVEITFQIHKAAIKAFVSSFLNLCQSHNCFLQMFTMQMSISSQQAQPLGRKVLPVISTQLPVELLSWSANELQNLVGEETKGAQNAFWGLNNFLDTEL